MKLFCVVVLALAWLCVSHCVVATLPVGWESLPTSKRAQLARELLNEDSFASQVNFFQRLFVETQEYRRQADLPHSAMTFECGLCGIVVNEVEGLLAENLTIEYIQAKLDTDLCSHLSGDLQVACTTLIALLPTMVTFVDNRWDVSVACIDLGFCTNAFPPEPLTVGMPTYVINLDLPPIQRWTQVCSNTTYIGVWTELVAYVSGGLPDHGAKIVDFGRLLNSLIEYDYALEVQGCAAALGVDYGYVTLAQIGYEASDACTSTVVQTDAGVIMHGRNLDFFLGGITSQLAKRIATIVEFQSGGVTAYTISTMAGYVGALSAASSAFSVTINTKFYPNGILGLFGEILAALEEGNNATLVSFLTRDAVAEATNFDEAVHMLSVSPLVADVYYTIAGTLPGQGTILSRNRESVENSTSLDAESGKWFVAVTNYPWWEPQPVVDDRLVPVQEHLEHYGPSISLDELFDVMSTKPTLNLETLMTFLTINSQGVYQTYARNCPYPCTQ